MLNVSYAYIYIHSIYINSIYNLQTCHTLFRTLVGHVAVTFGLLAALGGTRFFMVMSDGLDYASTSMLMLFLTGSAYTALCVRSFIAARKAREDAIES